jgi:hypothetical protein
MEALTEAEGGHRELVLRLSPADFLILEKFRGDLTPDAFISALLRMIDSGAVVPTPDWAKRKDKETT